MSPDDRDIVLIKEVIDLINLTTERVPKRLDQFLSDLDIRDATALRVQAIGEHMRTLSEVFRDNHPELPWSQSIGMRNIIAHEYGNLDFTIVWETVKGAPFKKFLKELNKIIK